MEQAEQIIQIISGLLAAFPSVGSSEGESTLRAYLLALEDAETGDIREGCRRLIAGKVAEHDGRYAPTPPQVARAARLARDDRLDEINAERRRHPQLPPPDVHKSPETRARVKAMVDQCVTNLAEMLRTDDAEADRRRKERVQRSFERFDPDPSPEATKRRLGFAVGDPDSEHDAA